MTGYVRAAALAALVALAGMHVLVTWCTTAVSHAEATPHHDVAVLDHPVADGKAPVTDRRAPASAAHAAHHGPAGHHADLRHVGTDGATVHRSAAPVAGVAADGAASGGDPVPASLAHAAMLCVAILAFSIAVRLLRGVATPIADAVAHAVGAVVRAADGVPSAYRPSLVVLRC